jgi:hypothetical protein
MNRLKLLFAWLLVGIPLAWGVTRSVQKSMPLFAAPTETDKPR